MVPRPPLAHTLMLGDDMGAELDQRGHGVGVDGADHREERGDGVVVNDAQERAQRLPARHDKWTARVMCEAGPFLYFIPLESSEGEDSARLLPKKKKKRH